MATHKKTRRGASRRPEVLENGTLDALAPVDYSEIDGVLSPIKSWLMNQEPEIRRRLLKIFN